MNRRSALNLTAMAGLGSLTHWGCQSQGRKVQEDSGALVHVLDTPVLVQSLFRAPIIISSMELLKNGKNFIVRVRSKEGAEGLAIAHNTHMVHLYPIFLNKIAPFFIGKDARNLEGILENIYLSNSNYKFQGLPFWVPLAGAEFAVLDLLGKVAGVPVGELFGKVYHPEIAVYQANNHRGKSAEESTELIQQSVEETGAKAVKYKIGGRMSKNQDDPPGRTEKLIPLVRKTLGNDMVIYADSNGSYDVPNSLRIGRLLQETGVSFFEEPCPFDHYDETKKIADGLDIDIAGGEQDSSLWMFKWMIEQNALQVVQPDLFYFGGMIRSMQVARMAQAKAIPCTPHISGTGLGYLYMLHFVSALELAGPFHEFKGVNKDLPFDCPDSDLISKNGKIKVPRGAGFGIAFEPSFLAEAKVLESVV